MSQTAPVISPADLAALVAKTQGRSFAPLTGLRAGEAAAGFIASTFATPTTASEPLHEAAVAEAPRDFAAELAEARALGLAEGMKQGRAAGLAEAEAARQSEASGRLAVAQDDLAQARDLFLAAAHALTNPPADQIAALAADLETAVKRLAEARAGLAIDTHPAAFVKRVMAVADRVAQGLREVSVTLNPADLAVVQAHLGEGKIDGILLGQEARLARGDVVVRTQGVALADLLEGTTP